jgi:hypothetical protein
VADYTPENPSERWRELVSLYQIMHAEGDGVRPPEKMFAGMPRGEQISRLRALIEHHDAKTLLDYGSGKGMQWRLDFNLDAIAETTEKRLKTYLGLTEIRCYDPGYEPFAKPPVGRFDGVICLDVLEHCPEEDIPWIMEHIFGFAKRFVFANIASFPAAKFLANGENAHCTVKPVTWWRALIDEISARHAGVKYLIICEEPVPGNRETREIRLEG